jgi:hypothetical protein
MPKTAALATRACAVLNRSQIDYVSIASDFTDLRHREATPSDPERNLSAECRTLDCHDLFSQ